MIRFVDLCLSSYGTSTKERNYLSCNLTFVILEVVEKVTKEMLAEFSSLTGKKLGKPIFSKLQLWGAALPMNVLKQGPAVIDPDNRVGICGDWLVSKRQCYACNYVLNEARVWKGLLLAGLS